MSVLCFFAEFKTGTKRSCLEDCGYYWKCYFHFLPFSYYFYLFKTQV